MFVAKRALFDALTAQTGNAQPLNGVQVAYSYPTRDMTRKCIYGGGIKSSQIDDEGATVAEFRVVIHEIVTIGLYVRVLREDALVATVRDADTDAEAIGDAISNVLTSQPHLGGGLTWLSMRAGQSDYAETAEGPESITSWQIEVQALLT
jgi:hypothetical protein